jgi:putative transposase
VRASKPNEIWHIDITQFVTADNVKHYIYTVIDNYSRKILAWNVESKVRAEYCKATVIKAFENLKDKSGSLQLISDGGSENNYEDISIGPPTIHHIRAQIDVRFSNSMIEAHFKIIKYNYLYKMEVKDGKNLNKILIWIHNDFKNRPHISLAGLSPNERHDNLSLDIEENSKRKELAKIARKEYNIANRCVGC